MQRADIQFACFSAKCEHTDYLDPEGQKVKIIPFVLSPGPPERSWVIVLAIRFISSFCYQKV